MPNSTAATLGLQSGDLLLEVDGKPALVNAIPNFDYDVLQRNNDEEVATGTLLYSRDGQVVVIDYSGGESAGDLIGDSDYLPVHRLIPKPPRR